MTTFYQNVSSVQAPFRTHRVDDDQQSIIRPCSQLHAAVLHVEREVQHNDLTVTLKDGRRVPGDQPGVLQQDFSLMDDGKVAVSAAQEGKETKGRV